MNKFQLGEFAVITEDIKCNCSNGIKLHKGSIVKIAGYNVALKECQVFKKKEKESELNYNWVNENKLRKAQPGENLKEAYDKGLKNISELKELENA